jgi:aminoglycoside phosphotransferase (APT) family kinase protein
MPDLMPHGYTNCTMLDGSVVTKTYQGPDADRRGAREAAALRGLAGRVPVPRVLSVGDGTLSMSLMPGVHGQELIDRGLASLVLGACGRTLRCIHSVDPVLACVFAGDSPTGVLLHGDYGPNNVLLDSHAGEVTAVLDWEWARTGDPAEDLAWAEWIVRMHHPAHVDALGALFDGYGFRPTWRARQEAMLAQCRSMLRLCERWDPGGPGTRQWRRRLIVTESWTE